MAGEIKLLRFSDGTTVTAPAALTIDIASLTSYANDAAFEAAKGSAGAGGDIYLNTTSGFVRYHNDTAWGSFIDESSVQTVSNKDIDGGTASNSLRVTVPKNTTTNLNGLTRKEGTVLYDTDTAQLKIDNGVTLDALSSAAIATPTTTGTVTSFSPTVKASVDSIVFGDSPYTITDSDGYSTVLADSGSGAITVNLPTAADNEGREILVKKTDSTNNKVTIDGEGAETIDGLTTFDLVLQYDYVRVVSDGTEWHITDYREVTAWTPYTTSVFDGYGTVIDKATYFRRVGSNLELRIQFTAGTVTGSFSRFEIPFSLTATKKVASKSQIVGSYASEYEGGVKGVHPIIITTLNEISIAFDYAMNTRLGVSAFSISNGDHYCFCSFEVDEWANATP